MIFLNLVLSFDFQFTVIDTMYCGREKIQKGCPNAKNNRYS